MYIVGCIANGVVLFPAARFQMILVVATMTLWWMRGEVGRMRGRRDAVRLRQARS